MFSTLRCINKFKPIRFKQLYKNKTIKSKFLVYHNKKQLYIPRLAPLAKTIINKRKFHTIATNKSSQLLVVPEVTIIPQLTINKHQFHTTNMKFKSEPCKSKSEELKVEVNKLNKLFVENNKLLLDIRYFVIILYILFVMHLWIR